MLRPRSNPPRLTAWLLALALAAAAVPAARAAELDINDPARNLHTHFDGTGVTVTPGARSGGSLTWALARFGRSEAMRNVASIEPDILGTNVRYPRDGFVEWYENRSTGIEQGFDVPIRPPGRGELRLEAHLSSNAPLRTELRDGAVEVRDGSGAPILHYGELHAWDATGRELPTRLELASDVLALVIDDGAAVYPITIDPLFTGAGWTADGNQANAGFGTSVAPAGDVNGDGYSDVIMSAPLYDDAESDVGLVQVYLGLATGPQIAPAWSVEGDQASLRLGTSVSTAGDVNGDGYDDVIVGAEYYSNGEASEGAAFLYLGSDSALATTPAWMMESNQTSAYFGRVGAAGDVNGDGYDDVIIGAYLYDGAEIDSGRAFLYLGTATGLDTIPAWTAEADQPDAWFGVSVAGAGDVNGDGYADVIVGADSYDDGEAGEGRAFVYLGSSAGLSPTPSWSAEPNIAGAHFGGSVAGAGDVNGDGYADVIVGASQLSDGQSLEGAAFVYTGSAEGLSSLAAWQVESNQNGAHLGTSVATAGDVDGDGFSDVIVGADEFDGGSEDEGQVRAYAGSPAGLSTTPFWTTESNQAGAALGASVATAGDVNGDGYSDVIVGAPQLTDSESREGRAFVYGGFARPLSSSWRLQYTSGLTGSFFGSSVAGAGDVNGDGYGDLVVGASYLNFIHSEEGGAFVYLGEPDDTSTALPLNGGQAGAHFGASVASAGDVNGDGYADLIIGAPDYDNGEINEGRAYVYLGSPNGVNPTPAWMAEADQAQAHFGGSVASAGDVNGDGYADIIVGAYQGGTGGEARVYLGSPAGLSPSPVWTGGSGQGSSAFGISVACAGDVNGDGYSDIVVGASFYDDGQTNEGAAFLYMGSSSGPALTPAWIGQIDQTAAAFGVSVASAGDVNGDGYADVIVGASGYDHGQADEGGVFLYIGSILGLPPQPIWTGESNEAGAQLGYSVSTAGDPNGDGYSDIVAGASLLNGAIADVGGALVWSGRPNAQPVLENVIVSDHASDFLGFSVAFAGDVNGDGFSDVILGAPLYDLGLADVGQAALYLGNGQGTLNAGLDRIPRQRRFDGEPIAPLGLTDHQNLFRIAARARTAAGRGRVHLEWEVKPVGVPCDGTSIERGVYVLDTGAPNGSLGSSVEMSEFVVGLDDETRYHWRVRVASTSPFHPRTPWLTMPYNAITEMDLRTTGPVLGVEDPTPPAASLLEPVPVLTGAGRVDVAYALPVARRARLAVYDVQGREVALLDEGLRTGGRHVVGWDGRTRGGARLGAGVYVLRLRAGEWSESRKLVVAH